MPYAFCTIGIFSTAIGMTGVLNKSYENATPFDITLQADGNSDIINELQKNNLNLSNFTDSPYQYHVYEYKKQALTLGMIFSSVEKFLPADKFDTIKEKIYPISLYFITVSDYNKILDLQGKPGIALSGNQAALLTQYAWMDADYQESLERYIAQGNTITLDGALYSIYPELLTEGIINGGENILTLVVPDAIAQNGITYQSVLCFNCKGETIAAQDGFMAAFSLVQKGSDSFSEFIATSKNELLAQAGGSKAIISFIGIYVGIVFLITSAAVLALQQLSEAADNRHRYAILKKIGADNALLGRTIFKQIAIYFLLPLSLACVHSIVGIKVANDAIRQVGSLNATMNIAVTAILILIIYGAYFLATYFGCRNIILKSEMQNL